MAENTDDIDSEAEGREPDSEGEKKEAEAEKPDKKAEAKKADGKKKDKQADGKKDKKADGKKGKGKGKGKGKPVVGSSIATHPRARGSIRRAKAWAGLAGFAFAAVLSLQASVPVFQVGERALAAGLVGYMLAWWCGVLIWRQLIIAEQRAAIDELERRRAAGAEQRPAEAQPARG